MENIIIILLMFHIYVNNPSTNGIICLTLNHQHDNKLCVPHDVAQPIQFTI